MEAFAANSQMMRLYEERIRDAEHVRASIRAERQSFEQQVELERRRADEEQRLRQQEQRLREESDLRAEDARCRAETAEMALAELKRQLEARQR